MPDAPQPVSKKRKANSEAASSSAPPPPEKKQRANSGRVSLAKSITTGTQLSTPSTRGPICPTAPASAPPRTKLCRSSVQQSAMTGPLTKSQLQPLRRRMRSSVTESSKKRADSSGMEDDTPPPVTALRRSSSGRIITSTPKIAAANEFGKPFGSAKTHLSRQKRKCTFTPFWFFQKYH
ncbi:hypothetical protein BDZ94DRAFT_644527 [Collybia nuda]|uniref:Uncharacterized protein n=1 Tax=Collybia nuda TaxID=64659 RepID=A0A9P6CI59_9AGAR|nr:hypothetical protein BDZ94DRAFT_644527 [Collybia nuda]